MLAFFEHQWIPNYENPAPQKGRDQMGFILSGDTYEELAWDLVEMILEKSSHQSHLRGSNVGSAIILSQEDRFPSLTHTLKYHDVRFTDDWWERHQWMLIDFLGGKKANGMDILNFKSIFTPEVLLTIYLTTIIGRYYAGHHGTPKKPLDSKVAIEWFEEKGYLKWLEVTDPKVLGNMKL